MGARVKGSGLPAHWCSPSGWLARRLDGSGREWGWGELWSRGGGGGGPGAGAWGAGWRGRCLGLSRVTRVCR